MLACYVHANVCQAVLLEIINSLNFQRIASSKVMDSAVHPREWGSSRGQQFLHRVPSPGILHRPESKEYIDSLPFTSTVLAPHCQQESASSKCPSTGGKTLQNLQPFAVRIRGFKAPAEFWTFVQYLWMMHGGILYQTQIIYIHL